MTGTGIIERWTSHGSTAFKRVQRWWPLTVAVRVIVALVLAFGPATDQASELAGWDAERFQEIAERDGAAWVDEPVEYPPGSVVVFDRLAGADVVDTHRRLLVASLILDLVVAVALARRTGRDRATAYLWLGLPLVPFGYQRLDLLVTAVAVAAALALLADRGRRSRAAIGDGVAALAIAVGAMIKIWPALLVVGAVAIGRWRAATGAVALTVTFGAAWLLAVGDGVGPVDQILSLRGATGWHVESLPGAMVALAGSTEAGLELNAYRIGTLRPGLVTAGRIVAVATMAALALLGQRRTGAAAEIGSAGRSAGDDQQVFALATLGSIAVLVVTAPLLSPQFLVWLVPFAALAVATGRLDGPTTAPVVSAAAATTLTGVALHGFGPAGLDASVPAAILTVRNLLLVAVVWSCVTGLTDRRRG